MVRGAARKTRIRKIAENEGVSYQEAMRRYEERGRARAEAASASPPSTEDPEPDHCDPTSGYHSTPHRRCVLR